MGSFDQACPSFKVQNSSTEGDSSNICSGTYVKDPDLQAWINQTDPTCRLQKLYSYKYGWQWSFIVTGQGGSVVAPPEATDIIFLWHPQKLTLTQKIYADLETKLSWGTNDKTAVGADVEKAGGTDFPLLSDQVSTMDLGTSYVQNRDDYISVEFRTGDCPDSTGVAEPPFQTHTKWDFADALLDYNVDDALRGVLTDFSDDPIDKCSGSGNNRGERWWFFLEHEKKSGKTTARIRSAPPWDAETSSPKLDYRFDGSFENTDGTLLDFDYCPSRFANDAATRIKTSFAAGESVELEYDYEFTGENGVEGVAKVSLLFEDWRLGWALSTDFHSDVRTQLEDRSDPAVPDDPATDLRPTMGQTWMLPGVNLDTTYDSNCPTDVDWEGAGLTVTPSADCTGGGLYSPGVSAEYGIELTGGPSQNASGLPDYSGTYVVTSSSIEPTVASGDVWVFSSPNPEGNHLIFLADETGSVVPDLDPVASFRANNDMPMATLPGTGGVNHGTLNFYDGGYYGDISGDTSIHHSLHWSLSGVCMPEADEAPSGITAAIAIPTGLEAPSALLAVEDSAVVAPTGGQAPSAIAAVTVVVPLTAQSPSAIVAVIAAPTEAQAPYGIGTFLDTSGDGVFDTLGVDTDGDGIPDIDDLTPGLTPFIGRSQPYEYKGFVYSELGDCVCGPFVGEQITALTSVRNSGKMVCVTKDLEIKQTNLLDFRERDFPEPPSGLWSDLTTLPSGNFIVGNKEGSFSYRNRNMGLSTPFATPHTGQSAINDPLYFEDAYLAIAETAWMHLGNEHNNKQVHRLDFNFSTGSFGHLWAYIQSDSEQGNVSGQYKGLIKDNVRVFSNIRGRRFRVKLFIATHKSYPWNLREMAVGHLIGKSF